MWFSQFNVTTSYFGDGKVNWKYQIGKIVQKLPRYVHLYILLQKLLESANLVIGQWQQHPKLCPKNVGPRQKCMLDGKSSLNL